MFKDGCIFCDDIAGKRRAAIVYEDDVSLAFMDLFPVEEGHTLVIPREHYENIFDIDAVHYSHVLEVGRVMAKAVLRALGADAINIGQNNGECANQRVMHYHLHIIPRWCDRNLNWERIRTDEKELNNVAQRIKEIFDGLKGELRFTDSP